MLTIITETLHLHRWNDIETSILQQLQQMGVQQNEYEKANTFPAGVTISQQSNTTMTQSTVTTSELTITQLPASQPNMSTNNESTSEVEDD